MTKNLFSHCMNLLKQNCFQLVKISSASKIHFYNYKYTHDKLVYVPLEINEYNDIWPHLSHLCSKLTDHFVYWGYNAEFLYFPFFLACC